MEDQRGLDPAIGEEKIAAQLRKVVAVLHLP
jgi:hypothetical protein